MKKRVIILSCAFVAAVLFIVSDQNTWSQDYKVPPVQNYYHVDSLKIIPETPYSDDDLYLIAYTTHNSGGCGLKDYRIWRSNGFIVVDATYEQGMLTYICHSTDTMKLGTLPAGKYFLLFDLTDTIGFTVYTNPQDCQAYYTYLYPKCGDSKCLNTVEFADSSSGNVTNMEWDFGDGNTSKEKNPVHQYENAGVYIVCLAIECEDGYTSSYCEKIRVGQPNTCKADFEIIYPDCYEKDVTDCLTNHVAFLDKSKGKVIQWTWDFGDGQTSDVQNPVHFYDIPGLYNVCLSILTESGCTDTYCDTVYIRLPKCKADFTWVPLRCSDEFSRCYGGYRFVDLSYSKVVKWFWNFGDGDTSTLQQPVHFYKNDGVYIVSLSIETAYGCTDRKTDTLVMGDTTPPCCKANFGWEEVFPDWNCTKKSTSCITPFYYVQFTDSSAGEILGHMWDFGDGTTSDEQNPHHVYKFAGSYTVCLTVKCEGWCYDILCRTVSVGDTIPEPCNADFILSEEILPCPKCAGCYCVKFLDNSSWNTEEWFWDFGDGDTSTLRNPEHMFTWYPGQPLFNVCLVIKTSDNCTDTVCKTYNPVEDTLIMDIADMQINPGNVVIFPNPADNQINIELPEDLQGKVCTITLSDMYGRSVTSCRQICSESYGAQFSHNVANLNNGQYICIIVSDNKLYKGRFTITR